jgi:hypothetical protein
VRRVDRRSRVVGTDDLDSTSPKAELTVSMYRPDIRTYRLPA